jgi:hypothetical protein
MHRQRKLAKPLSLLTFLKAAADLIQDSAKWIAVHPQLEQQENEKRWMTKLNGPHTPLSKLRGPDAKAFTVTMPDGTRKEWKPFNDNPPRGFYELVVKDSRWRMEAFIYRPFRFAADEGKMSLRERLTQLLATGDGLPRARDAIRLFNPMAYGFEPFARFVPLMDDAIAKAGSGTGDNRASRVLDLWLESCARLEAKGYIENWELHDLSVSEFASLVKARSKTPHDSIVCGRS